MRRSFVDAVRFFAANAGGVVGQTWTTALHLARAEHEAWCRDWTVAWEDDPDGDLGDHEYWCPDAKRDRCGGHEVLGAVLRDRDGNVLASLGGIIDPSREYTRVVEAELADEALAEERATIAKAKEAARARARWMRAMVKVQP